MAGCAGITAALNRGLVTAILVVFALVVSACGEGSADIGESVSSTPGTSELPADLHFLGGLAAPGQTTQSQLFDTTGGRLELDDGTTVTVPANALNTETEISALTVDLALGNFLSEAPEGTVYRVSTSQDVELATPVILEVAKPSDAVVVSQRVDGVWSTIRVPAGATTKISIDHFSDVTTAVIDRPNTQTAAREDSSDGLVPAVFLQSCVLMFALGDEDGYSSQLGLSVCTQALIEALTPPGESKVEVGCVGDNIGGDVDIRGAIAQCIADANAQAADASDESTAAGSATTPMDPGESGGEQLCAGNFAPPYFNTIEAQPSMLETVILGPLETAYYYTTVEGTIEVLEDGSFTLTARTVRLGDVTIRGEPDNQIYERDIEATGMIDLVSGAGTIDAVGSGTDQLWSGDTPREIGATQVEGQIIVACDDPAPGTITIYGTIGGQAYLLFLARP